MREIENALRVLEDWGGVGKESIVSNARAELAQLRAADIRTLEHCDDCGVLLLVDADTPEDETESQMYCPACRCAGFEQMIGVLRATIAGQARQLAEAREFAEYVTDNEMSTEQIYINAKNWLAANPPATICTCGTGGATMPEYHAKDCALYRVLAPASQAEQEQTK